MSKRIQTLVGSGVDHMPRKQTILERLRSLLWREHPEVRNTNQWTEASSPGAPLALEWATYEANKQRLLRHKGEWVVIHGEQVLGICASYEEALRLGYERAGYVDFLAHQVLENEPILLLSPQVD
jgi:hypothetical protein